MRIIAVLLVITTAACSLFDTHEVDGSSPHPAMQPHIPGEGPRVIKSFEVEPVPKDPTKMVYIPPPSAEMTQALPEQEEILAVAAEVIVEEYPTDILTSADLDESDGYYISVTGRFSHSKYKHGILTLDNGLVLWLPHIDQFQKGDDWLRYVGHNCTAGGILQTSTLDIDGYRGPSIDLRSFYGTGE